MSRLEMDNRAPAKPNIAPSDALTIQSPMLIRFCCPGVISPAGIGASHMRMLKPVTIRESNRMMTQKGESL